MWIATCSYVWFNFRYEYILYPYVLYPYVTHCVGGSKGKFMLQLLQLPLECGTTSYWNAHNNAKTSNGMS